MGEIIKINGVPQTITSIVFIAAPDDENAAWVPVVMVEAVEEKKVSA